MGGARCGCADRDAGGAARLQTRPSAKVRSAAKLQTYWDPHVALITVAGLVLGATVSIGLGRFVNALLFELVATDTTMVLIAGVALGAAAGVAGYLLARRAARVDPMIALRQD